MQIKFFVWSGGVFGCLFVLFVRFINLVRWGKPQLKRYTLVLGQKTCENKVFEHDPCEMLFDETTHTPIFSVWLAQTTYIQMEIRCGRVWNTIGKWGKSGKGFNFFP